MLLTLLLLIPLIGVFAISTGMSHELSSFKILQIKRIALSTSIINFILSLMIFILFDFSSNQFQFVQEYHEISSFDLYLGLDGLSIYFVMLTTMITPILPSGAGQIFPIRANMLCLRTKGCYLTPTTQEKPG